jgi:hypothetical protein
MTTNFGRIATLHPALQIRVWALIGLLWDQGVSCRVLYGFRSRDEQKVLYDKYRAGEGGKAAKPGLSFHNYGLACDMLPYIDRNHDGKMQVGEFSWDPEDIQWRIFATCADQAGLVHGRHFSDWPHVEFHPNLDIREALRNGQPHTTHWGTWSIA